MVNARTNIKPETEKGRKEGNKMLKRQKVKVGRQVGGNEESIRSENIYIYIYIYIYKYTLVYKQTL